MSSEAGKRLEAAGEIAVFGPFRLVPAARRIERNGDPVEIGDRALDVLIELVKRAGQVVSKAELMAAIWPDTTVVEGVLRTHVYNLRKALGDNAAGARYVTSVAGQGYCFVAPVVRTAAESVASAFSNAWTGPHGLPLRLARMAGRDDAIRKLAAQLAEHRFVTVLGAAGIGKTTVAVAVAHSLLDDFGGAVRFVDLGSLAEPGLVAPTVGLALGVPTQSDDVLERLQAFLQDKRVLLVLDNCEHVIDAAAHLAERLFLQTPRVHLLTTSREALGVEGEHAHRLGPLATPEEGLVLSAESVHQFPAVQVFLERAAASGWSADLTDSDAPIVAETCRRLDGVPLAIELAASFVGRYGLQGIAALLDDRLALLLQRGRRTAPPRQQTIHALIAWSYERLPEAERAALRRLSIFIGTFSFDAAKAIAMRAGDSDEPLSEVVNELVAKSLVSVIVEEGAVVYRLLETTRVYALEQLEESGEFDEMSLRRARLVVERMESAAPIRRRASALANIRAALVWCFTSPGDHAVGVRVAAATARLLLDLGLVTECHDWCRKALAVMEARERATLVELRLIDALADSAMYSTRGVDVHLRTTLNHGLELARMLGSKEDEVRLLGLLNAFLIRSGEWSEALEVATQSNAAAPGTVRAHWMLALSHHCIGNHALAQEHCEEGLRIAAKSNEAPMMHFRRPQVLMTLARTLWLRGQPDQALAMARSVLDDESMLNHPVDKCVALLLAVPIFLWRGDWDEAERLVDIMTEHVERHSLASHRGIAMALRGGLLVETGRPQDGCSLLKTAQTKLGAARNASHAPQVAGMLAEGLAATGSNDEALSAVEWAIAEARRRGGTWDLSESLRLKGVILASRSPTDAREVDATLRSAVEIAQRQGALAWELRATSSLTRERLRRGRAAADVFGDLSAVYAKFTEGRETRDLQAARNLLEQRLDR